MRQPYWKPQHEVFIRCMLKHEDLTKAYRTAYPRASAASARVGGIRLYNYPHIRQRLEPVFRQREEEATQLMRKAGEERVAREEARRLEMRRYLCRIINKKIRKQRHFKIGGRVVTVEDDLSSCILLNAMVLDLKLEAGYHRWDIMERQFARIVLQTQSSLNGQQTVMNSAANAIQARHCSQVNGCPSGTNNNSFICQQTVINSPSNAARARLSPG